MARWKLCRVTFGKEEYTFNEGDEVTVGRAVSNTIVLASIVVSRNHGVLNIQKDQVTIIDLKSSNGIYVGKKKIQPGIPFILKDSDLIGFGWTEGITAANLSDNEKFVFKLCICLCTSPYKNRIIFQNDLGLVEGQLAELNNSYILDKIKTEPLDNEIKVAKRKIDDLIDTEQNKNAISFKVHLKTDDIIQLSDSDSDKNNIKKPKLNNVIDDSEIPVLEVKQEIKSERDQFDFEAFSVKQEYLGYDEEPIQIDSDSDCESQQWLIRLSQNSPGKAFMKVKANKKSTNHEDSSYSQLDDIDDGFAENDDYLDDLVSLPQPIEVKPTFSALKNNLNESAYDEEILDDLITLEEPNKLNAISIDEVDGFSSNQTSKHISKSSLETNICDIQCDKIKKIQLIEPLPKVKSHKTRHESKSKSPTKTLKVKKHSKSKISKNSCQKEELSIERKKKLKELANKEKEQLDARDNSSSNVNKPTVKAKVTTFNRGAFLTDIAKAVVKPSKRNKIECETNQTKPKNLSPNTTLEVSNNNDNIENRQKVDNVEPSKKHKDKSKSKSKSKSSHSKSKKSLDKKDESKNVLKVKPLGLSDDPHAGKPISKVIPTVSQKSKKKVSFSSAPPAVRLYEIEPGHKMRKTSLVKNTLVDIRQNPVFSLEKITLTKILRWNPQWLDEQINNHEPPPILGHNNSPMAIFHSFNDHGQYVQLVGDLLLMEIWECFTQAYSKIRNDNVVSLAMRIESLPPVPTLDRYLDLFSLSVNISLPKTDTKNIPRTGEILIVIFGGESDPTRRFFFVHNVRLLPSPANNIHAFYSISLHATYTDKMKLLKPGEIILARNLTYINKELMLFNAMEYLAGSPLSEAILRPEPKHFVKPQVNPAVNMTSQWTMALNPSQQAAVMASVSAALSDKPIIQMVQGPPGTGKSSVICAIVMSYFYDSANKRMQNRGKILICATSNAAVDELVIRLLNIRQSLPKSERFRMVRVGRAEAMHPRAFDVSSQQLAQRDAVRSHAEPTKPGLNEEMSTLEAKINMWKTAAQEAKDPVRVAYCQNRITQLANRVALLRTGGGGRGRDEVRGDQLAAAERRIIEGADILVTTLSSVHNHKMKGLKRRIALCIVDEAGQAIEPETLIPLTLDVTRLTLIGDPQQLPGFICSQRAKTHGLGESLFSRLTSCAEQWRGGSPVFLLNQQYRMHREIADYPNRAFYDGQIQSVTNPNTDLTIPPYSLVSISSGDKGQGHINRRYSQGYAEENQNKVPALMSLNVTPPFDIHNNTMLPSDRSIPDCILHVKRRRRKLNKNIKSKVQVQNTLTDITNTKNTENSQLQLSTDISTPDLLSSSDSGLYEPSFNNKTSVDNFPLQCSAVLISKTTKVPSNIKQTQNTNIIKINPPLIDTPMSIKPVEQGSDISNNENTSITQSTTKDHGSPKQVCTQTLTSDSSLCSQTPSKSIVFNLPPQSPPSINEPILINTLDNKETSTIELSTVNNLNSNIHNSSPLTIKESYFTIDPPLEKTITIDESPTQSPEKSEDEKSKPISTISDSKIKQLSLHDHSVPIEDNSTQFSCKSSDISKKNTKCSIIIHKSPPLSPTPSQNITQESQYSEPPLIPEDTKSLENTSSITLETVLQNPTLVTTQQLSEVELPNIGRIFVSNNLFDPKLLAHINKDLPSTQLPERLENPFSKSTENIRTNLKSPSINNNQMDKKYKTKENTALVEEKSTTMLNTPLTVVQSTTCNKFNNDNSNKQNTIHKKPSKSIKIQNDNVLPKVPTPMIDKTCRYLPCVSTRASKLKIPKPVKQSSSGNNGRIENLNKQNLKPQQQNNNPQQQNDKPQQQNNKQEQQNKGEPLKKISVAQYLASRSSRPSYNWLLSKKPIVETTKSSIEALNILKNKTNQVKNISKKKKKKNKGKRRKDFVLRQFLKKSFNSLHQPYNNNFVDQDLYLPHNLDSFNPSVARSERPYLLELPQNCYQSHMPIHRNQYDNFYDQNIPTQNMFDQFRGFNEPCRQVPHANNNCYESHLNAMDRPYFEERNFMQLQHESRLYQNANENRPCVLIPQNRQDIIDRTSLYRNGTAVTYLHPSLSVRGDYRFSTDSMDQQRNRCFEINTPQNYCRGDNVVTKAYTTCNVSQHLPCQNLRQSVSISNSNTPLEILSENTDPYEPTLPDLFLEDPLLSRYCPYAQQRHIHGPHPNYSHSNIVTTGDNYGMSPEQLNEAEFSPVDDDMDTDNERLVC